MREGFEPSVQFPVRQFSKLILSASQAPHHGVFLRTANIVIQLSLQKIISFLKLVVNTHMIDAHQHAFEHRLNSLQVLQCNVTIV